MNLQMRFNLLTRLGAFMLSDDKDWIQTKEKASRQNSWFTPGFIDLAIANIANQFLQKEILDGLKAEYNLPDSRASPKSVGLIMAGNIPLVGFHDFLSVFISGNKIRIKTSSKDDVLIKYMVQKLIEWEPALATWLSFEEMLKSCDAYIATGSNNSSRYFEYYFSKYPHIIRRNRTSVAVLDSNESFEELQLLADDVHLFFGLGCRNVTKIYVPADYDFIPLIEAFNKYNYFKDHNKYKNNYDYNLALHILNRKYYMANESLLLSENTSIFSPISQLNYEFYTDKNEALEKLNASAEIQCIVGNGFVPFGKTQCPSITDFADGVDTLKFLASL
jgi:hypothetical protein